MKHDFHIIFSLFSGAGQLQKKRAMLTIASIAWGTAPPSFAYGKRPLPRPFRF